MPDRAPSPLDLLDDIGLHLLRELQRDARLSFADLARQVGLTAPAVAERVRRMEAMGLIQGYRAEVNRAALGLKLTAFIRLRTNHGRDGDLERFAAEQREVLECHEVAGEESYLLKVAATDVQHLDRLLTTISGFGATHSTMVLTTKIASRVLEPFA
ncbi:Lrp/AsnC family transcriptional regulator [Niveispirillum cyanobacteriorum]|uniref:AsnC family transcriptional regulator n=1 Tax=Niveispirillum cyanobacteriorum TaxID=1612173 RepID=A0A2K9NM98_9PROT|nr:Lrp/AsnC family transcriptional regulator [Niveispirillum cyanobacteriorum]AUN33726.1 AsnC family transcriptional regulator [Niveispirillum cyanobacteriorum]GGE82221.1 AsnC family transcriptional regulator [Niveispirillum cyanobacteriorum]